MSHATQQVSGDYLTPMGMHPALAASSRLLFRGEAHTLVYGGRLCSIIRAMSDSMDIGHKRWRCRQTIWQFMGGRCGSEPLGGVPGSTC